ncbi:MAG: hypothetical protein F4139_11215 [Gemmatimonadetes bacterium]|nr:hypothetical protein [Gemmatimonadota bacterium]MYK66131.1 hypothetical protein [Gemmatimonadota bacterium]
MRGTGLLRPGGWVVVAVVLLGAVPARNAADGGRLAGLPSEVAGSVGGCETGPRMVGGPRGPAPGPHRLAFGSMGAISSPSDLVTDGGGPEYYRFPMVSTRRVPGTGNATGVGEVAFAQSPFGVALADDGSYDYDFTVRFERLRHPRSGTFVVWATTPELDQITLAGELTDPVSFSGKVAWNKFLVVVTLEPAFDPDATMWTGPIVIRGMSRSGMMHTMAGHGPFEEENCAAYGYE